MATERHRTEHSWVKVMLKNLKKIYTFRLWYHKHKVYVCLYLKIVCFGTDQNT